MDYESRSVLKLGMVPPQPIDIANWKETCLRASEGKSRRTLPVYEYQGVKSYDTRLEDDYSENSRP